jgi:CHAT domain-containing protein/tetratricopeptide (TPR) repeat protein
VRSVSILFLVLCGCARRPHASPDALYHQAETLLKQGNLEGALANADNGFRAEPSWRFRLLKADILISVKPQEAIAVLDTAEPPPSAELRADQLLRLGQAKLKLSDLDSAEQAFREAHDLAEPLGMRLLDARIEMLRGTLLAQRGKDGAEGSFRTAIREATDQGDRKLEANALGRLGVLFLRTHRADEAIFWLEKYREVLEQLGSADFVANAIGNLGSGYWHLGDYDKALSYLRDAEERSRKVGNQDDRQTWLGNIGDVLHEREDYAGAVNMYKSALEIARTLNETYWIVTWLNDLARTLIDLGDFDAAERYNREALRLNQNLADQTEFYPRLNAALIAAGRKDLVRAEQLYRSVLKEQSDDPTPMLDAESGLAELLVQTGRLDRADAQFRSAIALVESRQVGLTRDEFKLSYLSSLIRFYQRYVDFLITRGQKEKALEVAESSRARVLDEELQTGAKTNREVSAAAFRQLARSSGSTLLSYWLAPDRSFLWVITPTGIDLHELPPERQIAALVTGYRSFIEGLSDPLQSEYPAGKKLSEILLGPVRPLLASDARVIAVPDRALHSLNIETLPAPDHPSQYLIERVTVAVAPSLGLLTATRQPAKAQRSILMIGNPETAVEEYPRLPFAAKEMELVGRNFAPERRAVRDGARAYPAAYREAKPERFSWIHFAAHATANRENPLDSALILSRHESGYALSAREVMKVPLDADLVTLSACRSAGAKMYSGEGLVGLSWAFLRAGARSVIAGLWDVTDISTPVLMGDFYEQLSKNEMPADALRHAKLQLIHSRMSYRKPFYWGPFQLYVGTDTVLRKQVLRSALGAEIPTEPGPLSSHVTAR